MSGSFFDGIWNFGQMLCAFDPESDEGRDFRGFVEPIKKDSDTMMHRDRMGIVSDKKFRLICEPSEIFPLGLETKIVFDYGIYELLSISEVYEGNIISHRECIIRKIGEVKNNA